MKRKLYRTLCALLALSLLLSAPVRADRDAGKAAGPSFLFRTIRALEAETAARQAHAQRKTALRRPLAVDKHTPLYTNLSAVQYIHQYPHTCKATSAAMAANLLQGTDDYSICRMGLEECVNTEWLRFTGSDGTVYAGVYGFDEERGSAGELYAAIDKALATGIPIVAGIHSLRPGYTQHHWVLVVGRVGRDYMIVDPAYGEGGMVGDHLVPLSRLRYTFGLNDYPTPHYVYMTFAPAEDETAPEE